MSCENAGIWKSGNDNIRYNMNKLSDVSSREYWRHEDLLRAIEDDSIVFTFVRDPIKRWISGVKHLGNPMDELKEDFIRERRSKYATSTKQGMVASQAAQRAKRAIDFKESSQAFHEKGKEASKKLQKIKLLRSTKALTIGANQQESCRKHGSFLDFEVSVPFLIVLEYLASFWYR